MPVRHFPRHLFPHAFEAVVNALGRIFQTGELADKVVPDLLRQNPKWGSRDRRFFAEAVYDCVRWWRRLCYAAGLDDSAFLSPDYLNQQALSLVFYAWLNIHNKNHPENEIFFKQAESESFFVAKDAYEKWQNPPGRATRESIPDWLDHYGESQWAEKWPALLSWLNKPAQVYIRVNTLKTTTQALLAELQKDGIGAISSRDLLGQNDALCLAVRKNITTLPSFQNGLFEIQDIGSQKIAPFLAPEPGMSVIDACAGGGGKSLHLACLMQNRGKILALDKNDWRLKPLQARAHRASATIIKEEVIDSVKTIRDLKESCDRLLLDVPCSGSGVLRRKPATKWKLSPAGLNELLGVQEEILQEYSKMTKKGGFMVYSTCSVFPSENELQIRKFLASDEGKRWQFLEDVYILPSEKSDSDGYYMARLKRL